MKSFMIFLKGLLMGASDVVPGVSGGTIAFITGIYERLIRGVKDLNIIFAWFFVLYLFTKKKAHLKRSRDEFSRIDIVFFIPLGLGIVIAFGVGSRIIPYFLENHPVYLFAFFTGLILGSIKIVFGRAKRIDALAVAAAIIGFFLGLTIVGIQSFSSNHSLPMLFFTGFIAISAMLLPGISGSFIVLILGQYEYMLHALRDFQVLAISAFMVGAVLGLVSFARLMSYLLKKYHSITILFLTGLMFGALRKPVEEIIYVNSLNPALGFVWSPFSIILCAVLGLIGLVLVLYLER